VVALSHFMRGARQHYRQCPLYWTYAGVER
jgi:hypothetical protein